MHDKDSFYKTIKNLKKLDEDNTYDTYTLVGRTISKPIEGSVTWSFSVENLLGWTMGEVVIELDWEKRKPCDIIHVTKAIKSSWTAPLITVDQPQFIEELAPKPNKNCPEGIMDCRIINIELSFHGPLNNIPFRRWYKICADCTSDYGPR